MGNVMASGWLRRRSRGWSSRQWVRRRGRAQRASNENNDESFTGESGRGRYACFSRVRAG